MKISLEETARYMRMGTTLPEGELAVRIDELVKEAPIKPKGIWARFDQRFFLCGTIGSEFDLWQRRLSLLSATDALIAQAIGAAAVEQVMDDLEAEVKNSLSKEEKIKHRWSPGYPPHPLSMNAEIISLLDATKKIGVSSTDSMMLTPSKSVVAVCEVIL